MFISFFADYSRCGQGDAGNIKFQQLHASAYEFLFGRAVGGRGAANGVWPWQAVISHYNGLTRQWPRSYYVSKMFLLKLCDSYRHAVVSGKHKTKYELLIH